MGGRLLPQGFLSVFLFPSFPLRFKISRSDGPND